MTWWNLRETGLEGDWIHKVGTSSAALWGTQGGCSPWTKHKKAEAGLNLAVKRVTTEGLREIACKTFHLPLLQAHADRANHLLRTNSASRHWDWASGCPGLSLYHKLTNCHSELYTIYFSPQPFTQTLGLTIHVMKVRILRSGWSQVSQNKRRALDCQ